MIIFCVLGSPARPAADEAGTEPGLAARENAIVVIAERAWETPDRPDLFNLQGNVEVHATDWSLEADEVEVHGALQQPEKIVARGHPATAIIIRGGERISVRALSIDYQRDAARITLSGDVSLRFRDSTIRTDRLSYDIDRGLVESSDAGGVSAWLREDTGL